MIRPYRGDIWLVDLNPSRGREQAGLRPALIVSVDPFNHGPAELVVAIPMTSKAKNIPLHVRVDPPEGGVKLPSYIKVEDVRSLSAHRLVSSWGRVSSSTLAQVEDRLRILLGL